MPKPYIPNDAWSRRAAKEGYRARSVYKLQELDTRFKLLERGQTVLDLGAAPGSWLQYVANIIGPKGKAIGIDLQDIQPIADNIQLYQADIMDAEDVQGILQEEHINKVDLVLSDIAPATSGVRDIDQWKSIELADAVIAIAHPLLRPGARCVVKVFRGADFDDFLGRVRRKWRNPRLATVKASRDRSKEVYVVMTKP